MPRLVLGSRNKKKLGELVDLLGSVVRQNFGEEVDEMPADETFEVVEGAGRAGSGVEHLLDSAADVLGGVQQSAVYVKQINAELGDAHAGEGRSPSERPGTRRPTSGRITCCV